MAFARSVVKGAVKFRSANGDPIISKRADEQKGPRPMISGLLRRSRD